jgi:hypothetical protein
VTSAPTVAAAVEAPPSAAAPAGPLTVAEARRYMLDLVNADRRSMGLAPVALDESGPAARAGEAHAREMATFGYLGHLGLDGSVPEERMTRAGGAAMVLENASCFTDEHSRSVDPDPRIDPADVARTESMFFHETPPNDGHRRNILKAIHTKVAIGIAQPRRTPTEIPAPCFTQEFVDDFAELTPLPVKAIVGDRVKIEGVVRAPAVAAGVGLARVDFPKRLTAHEVNTRPRAYPIPAPYEMFWTPGFQTRIPLVVKGEHFAIDLPLDDHHAPGMYEVSVWAKVPGASDYTIVSLRTIRVEARE